MGSPSIWHVAVMALVVILVFGHRRIPSVLLVLGTFFGKLRKAVRSPPFRRNKASSKTHSNARTTEWSEREG
jgi:Sec-independent protein translocase protein TatA